MILTVVIPALDEAERITGAVGSARAPGVEVVVVDGGSRDGTAARAANAGARVVVASAGRARQLAAGVAVATGETLLFLHADTRLPRGFEAAVGDALRDPGVVGGAFRFHFDRASGPLRVVEWGARLRDAWFGLPYGDQGIFVRREALEAIGGVPQVPIMEDLDLVQGLRRIGRLARVPLAVTTSARRYEGRVWRQMFRNWGALFAWRAGLDRTRVAAWYGS